MLTFRPRTAWALWVCPLKQAVQMKGGGDCQARGGACRPTGGDPESSRLVLAGRCTKVYVRSLSQTW